MKTKGRLSRLSVFILALLVLGTLPGAAIGAVQEPVESGSIPWEGATVLPEYVGAPVEAQPLPPTHAPQNPFFAPNPFNNYHNDTWMSDTYDNAGPLGRNPVTWSSNLAAARAQPMPSPLFHCGSLLFDKHGRIVTICQSETEGMMVMVDPLSLEVITSLPLPPLANMAQRMGAAYTMLDNLDRVWTAQGDHLFVIGQAGGRNNPKFGIIEDYDLSAVVPAGDKIGSVVPDWRGRIWFVVRDAAIVGVFDPVTESVQQLQLGQDEEIANSFAIDGLDAYVVSTRQLYRLTAGDDNVPYVVWSAGYKNDGIQKPGQISNGSGTTPTILGDGAYVAIADNARQTHVVVYRTDEQLSHKEDRIVCQVPVFRPGLGAIEDSLVGSGRSIIASNNYGWLFIQETLLSPPSEPGVARVDIDEDGKGCHKVWTNMEVIPAAYGAKLSTETGLAYLTARKPDPVTPGLDVWYWTAIDFRTGETVWEVLAGTGRWFDGYWPMGFIGPTGILYAPGYGGIFAMRDTP